MQFSEIEGAPSTSTAVSGLVHRVAWPPVLPAEEFVRVEQVALVCSDRSLMRQYADSLPDHVQALQLLRSEGLEFLVDGTLGPGTVVAYIPARVSSNGEVFEAAEDQTYELLEITKYVIEATLPVKVSVLTRTPDHFGGLLDSEDRSVPLTAMKYIRGADMIRIQDGVPRTARLRLLPSEPRTQAVARSLHRPQGTYPSSQVAWVLSALRLPSS
ncbi:hypothetical protein BJX99DRAFT_229815 [Aspergillus californicus]